MLVLIDGLPHWKVSWETAPFLASIGPDPVEPGLGFSINIYPELFAGRRPDELGYFNKWQLIGREEYRRPGLVSRMVSTVADWTRRSQYASRALHKAWEALTRQGNLANIPFSMMQYYAANPSEQVFITQEYPTIFNRCDMDQIHSTQFTGGIGDRDRQVVDSALQWASRSPTGSLFLLLGDLDCVAHAWGLGQRFDDHVKWLDENVLRLADGFRDARGADAHVVVLSDHGMAETEPGKAVSISFDRFGPVAYQRYVPFWDALMLRVWIQDAELLDDMVDYVKQHSFGELLDTPTREYFGVTSRQFGDIIYLLKEGYAFYPSFFGARFPKALHGYDPRLDSQQAYFGYLGPNRPTAPSTAVEVFAMLQDLVGIDQVGE